MAARRLVERTGDNLAANGPLHLGHFLRTFIDQQVRSGNSPGDWPQWTEQYFAERVFYPPSAEKRSTRVDPPQWAQSCQLFWQLNLPCSRYPAPEPTDESETEGVRFFEQNLATRISPGPSILISDTFSNAK